MANIDQFMMEAKLRYLLYAAIVELEYVQSAEDHSQCASAKGREIIKRGMELLGVDNLEAESITDRSNERP